MCDELQQLNANRYAHCKKNSPPLPHSPCQKANGKIGKHICDDLRTVKPPIFIGPEGTELVAEASHCSGQHSAGQQKKKIRCQKSRRPFLFPDTDKQPKHERYDVAPPRERKLTEDVLDRFLQSHTAAFSYGRTMPTQFGAVSPSLHRVAECVKVSVFSNSFTLHKTCSSICAESPFYSSSYSTCFLCICQGNPCPATQKTCR